MKSKPFFIGAFAVGWIVLFVLSCAGPGDNGSFLLAMLAPFVVLASAVGVVWGIVERRKSKTLPHFNTAGIVMNAVILCIAFYGLCIWFSASAWPKLAFRFPKDVPVYPGGMHILHKATTRDSNGRVVERNWELFAAPQFGETVPEYEQAETFYDTQLPSANKRKDGGNVYYSYLNAKGKSVKIAISTAGSIQIRESN